MRGGISSWPSISVPASRRSMALVACVLRSGHRTPGGFRCRGLQHLGSAAPSDAAALSRRRVGAVCAASCPGTRYKFAIVGRGGWRLPLKADPLARATETPPPPHRSSPIRRRMSGATRLGCGSVESAMAPTRRSRSTRCTPRRGFIATGASRRWDELAERLVPYIARWDLPTSN